MLEGLPYVWRMLKDICSIRRCLVLILLYLVSEVVASLIPAISLWSVSQSGRVLTFSHPPLGILDSSSYWYDSLHPRSITFDIAQVETGGKTHS